MRDAIDSPAAVPADPDLAEQAKPGHGVPSQDPEAAAQIPMDPALGQAEERSVVVGGGAMAGAATGAAIGTVVAGPVGILVGGTLAAVAGAVGGAAAGSVQGDDEPRDAQE